MMGFFDMIFIFLKVIFVTFSRVTQKTDAQLLLKLADLAMCEVKSLAKSRFVNSR